MGNMEEMKLSSKAIKLSAEAKQEVLRLMADGNHEGKSLRIGVTGGGCAGFYYQMDFDQEKPEDIAVDFDEVRIIIDPAHLIYLEGMEIDYKGGLDSRGFIFNNPNAESTCGCGSSFG